MAVLLLLSIFFVHGFHIVWVISIPKLVKGWESIHNFDQFLNRKPKIGNNCIWIGKNQLTLIFAWILSLFLEVAKLNEFNDLTGAEYVDNGILFTIFGAALKTQHLILILAGFNILILASSFFVAHMATLLFAIAICRRPNKPNRSISYYFARKSRRRIRRDSLAFSHDFSPNSARYVLEVVENSLRMAERNFSQNLHADLLLFG